MINHISVTNYCNSKIIVSIYYNFDITNQNLRLIIGNLGKSANQYIHVSDIQMSVLIISRLAHIRI